MKSHFGYFLQIGASAADVYKRKGMLDTEQDREMLEFDIRIFEYAAAAKVTQIVDFQWSGGL